MGWGTRHGRARVVAVIVAALTVLAGPTTQGATRTGPEFLEPTSSQELWFKSEYDFIVRPRAPRTFRYPLPTVKNSHGQVRYAVQGTDIPDWLNLEYGVNFSGEPYVYLSGLPFGTAPAAGTRRVHRMRLLAVDGTRSSARSPYFNVVVTPYYQLELSGSAPDVTVRPGAPVNIPLNFVREPNNGAQRLVTTYLQQYGLHHRLNPDRIEGTLRHGFPAVDNTAATGTANHYPVHVTVFDLNADLVQYSFNIIVEEPASPPPVTMAAIADQRWRVMQEVELQLPATTGGTGSLTYTLSPELPAGLTLSDSPTGHRIVGTPSAASARQQYRWTATDEDDRQVEQVFNIQVAPAQPVPTPRGFSAVSRLGGVLLYWSSAPESDSVVTGFEVQRRVAGSDASFSRIALLGLQYRYTDAGLATTQQYDYRVVAMAGTRRSAPTPWVTKGASIATAVDFEIGAPQDYLWVYGVAGRPMSFQLPEATGGAAPYTYELQAIGIGWGGLLFDESTRILSISTRGSLGFPIEGTITGSMNWIATDQNGQQSTLRINYRVTGNFVPEFLPVPSVIRAVRGQAIEDIVLRFGHEGDVNRQNLPAMHVIGGVADCGLRHRSSTSVSGGLVIYGVPNRAGDCSIRVTVHDSDHEFDSVSFILRVAEPAPTPPTNPPTELEAVVSTNPHVLLRWRAPAGRVELTGFKVQYQPQAGANWETLAEAQPVTGTWHTYLHRNTTRNAQYAYRIAGVNTAGTGPYSEVLTVNVIPTLPPPPTEVRVNSRSRGLEVSWTPPFYGWATLATYLKDELRYPMPEVTGYTVQYAEADAQGGAAPDFQDGATTVANQTTAIIPGLSTDTAYLVRVLARTLFGNTDWTASTNGRTNANSAPVFTLPAGGMAALQSITVDENTPVDTVVSEPYLATDPEGEEVTTRLGEQGHRWSVLSWQNDYRLKLSRPLDYEALRQEMSPSTQGVQLSASVDAIDPHGATTSIEITITVNDVDEPPLAPTELTANEVLDDSVLVGWTAPDDTGRPPVTRYEFMYDCHGDRDAGTPIIASAPFEQDTTARVAGLQAGQRCRFAVRAFNDEGVGAWSDWLAVTTSAPPVFAEASPARRSIPENTAGGVPIGAPIVATPAAGLALTYVLSPSLASHVTIDSTSGQLLTKAGTTYDFETAPTLSGTVTASAANVSAELVVEVSITNVIEPPAPVVVLPVVAYDYDRVNLSWQSGDGAGLPPVTGHEFQYRDDANEDFIDVTPETSTATTAVIAGLEASTSYTFRVRAVNADGTSDWSATVEQTTELVPVYIVEPVVTRVVRENTAGVRYPLDEPVDTHTRGSQVPTYELTGEVAESFLIDAVGQIFTHPNHGHYDFEDKESYTGTVRVTQGTYTAEADVRIDVEDLPEPPLPPWSFRVTYRDGGHINLRWQGPDERGRPATESFEFQAKADDAEEWTDVQPAEINDGWAKFLGLTAASYTFQMRARNDEGGGMWSVEVDTSAFEGGPEFPNSTVELHVAENAAGGEPVGAPVTVTAAEGRWVIYTLSGRLARTFTVDRWTGQLSTRSGVTYDHESQPSYSGVMYAFVGGGEDTVQIVVHVDDVDEPPATPEQVTVAAAGPEQLLVSWSVAELDGHPLVSGIAFQSRKSGSGPFISATPTAFTAGSSTATFDGLDADTEYEFQVRSINDEGESAWSTVAAGRTTAVPLDTMEVRLQVDENTVAGATVGLPLTDNEPEASGFKAVSGDLALFDVDTSTGQVSVGAGATLDHEAQPAHSLTVLTTNSDSTRTQMIVQITVNDVDEPPLAVPMPTAGGSGTHSITVTWSAPDMQGRPEVTRYEVEFRVATAAAFDSLAGAAITDTTATLTGLLPDTDYEFRVRAINDEGTGPWSAVGTGRTLAAEVGVVVSSLQMDVREPNYEPTFTESEYARTVSHNAAAGKAVGAPIVATDRNVDDELAYWLTDSEHSELFEIDGTTGQLTVAEPGLDAASTTDTYILLVAVTDGRDMHGEPSGAEDATVRVVVAVQRPTPPTGSSLPSRGEALGSLQKGVASSLTSSIVERFHDGGGSAGLWVDGQSVAWQEPTVFTEVDVALDEQSPFAPEGALETWGGTQDDLLYDAKFETILSLNGTTADSIRHWRVWGTGERLVPVDPHDSTDRWRNGTVGVTHIGTEMRDARGWLTGLSIGRSIGALTLEIDDEKPQDVDWRAVSVHPYARWALNEDSEVWAIAGVQSGEVRWSDDTVHVMQSHMLALGGRHAIATGPDWHLDVYGRTDTLRTEWRDDRVASVSIFDQATQLSLRADRSFAMLGVDGLRAFGEMGIRQERDDGASVRGGRLLVGVEHEGLPFGWGLDATMEQHEPMRDSGRVGQRFTVGLAKAADHDGRGWDVSIQRRWNHLQDDEESDDWWASDGGVFIDAADASGDWQGRVGYGWRAFGGEKVVSPYGEFSDGGANSERRLRLGLAVGGGQSADNWSIDLYGARIRGAWDDESEIGVDASIQF